MNEEILPYELEPFIENQLQEIDEEKLPQVFGKQINLLKEAQNAIKTAEEKKKEADAKVENALKTADALIEKAKNSGNIQAEKSKFLWKEYTSKKDDIEAIKKNLEEIKSSGNFSATMQKDLAETQNALVESQTALLEVQKAQMEYQKQIAYATKFVFGLSAYNMASSQSVLIKLRAILSGASEEELGELAQQQLFLALDQIRNQENLITRIKENENLIEELNLDIAAKQKEIEKIGEIDEEQNRKIFENAKTLDEHEEILKAQQEKDEEFAQMFAEQDLEDAEQDKKISENAKVLDEHEEILKAQQEKDEEFAQMFAEQDLEDAEQDKKISENAKALDEHEEILKTQQEKDEEFAQMFAEQDLEDAEQDKKISENAKVLDEHKEILKAQQQKMNETEECIAILTAHFKEEIVKLKDEIETTNKKIHSDITSIDDNIDLINFMLKKKIWKIAISIVAISSLILNVLQILNIL